MKLLWVGNLTQRLYLRFFEEVITPEIVTSIENVTFDYDSIPQQDGTPPHFYVPVRVYLGQEYEKNEFKEKYLILLWENINNSKSIHMF